MELNTFVRMPLWRKLFVGAACMSLAAVTGAQDYSGELGIEASEVKIGKPEYSPHLYQSYPNRVMWGDTHLHTSYSTDAGMIGNFLGPEFAYRFARGETVRASGGMRAKLVRPLDFLVVADHAENLGLAALIAESAPGLLRIAWGKKVHDLVKAGKPFEAYGEWGLKMSAREDPINDDALSLSVWRRIIEAAEKYNQPDVVHGSQQPAPRGRLPRRRRARRGPGAVLELR
jgi:hypothetical protein